MSFQTEVFNSTGPLAVKENTIASTGQKRIIIVTSVE